MKALFFAVVYFGVIGAAAKRVLARRSESPLEWVGTSLLYGVGAVGLLGQIAGALSIPLGVPFFGVLFAAAVVALLVTRPSSGPSLRSGPPSPRFAGRRGNEGELAQTIPSPREAGRGRHDPRAKRGGSAGEGSIIAYVAMAITLIPIAVLLLNCVTTPVTDYDGRVTWVLKARAIAREHSITGPFFQGLTARDAHSHYPLLMPIADAALLEIAHEDDDRFVKPAYALTALGFLLALAATVSSVAPVEVAWLVTACVAWLPQFAADGDGGMLSAYSDVPLVAFTTLALLSILRSDGVPVELAFVVCAKNEGLIVVIALLVFAGFRRWKLRDAIVLAVTIAALALWRWRIPLEHDENYGRLVFSFGKLLGNVPVAARELLSRMGDLHAWGGFWALTFVALCVGNDRRRWNAALALAIILGAYISAYAVTNWASVAELAVSSANRLLLHCVPFAAVLLGLAGRRLYGSNP